MISELFDLTGKVAVVTGGSRGIGAAVATGFAEAGAHVVIASRKIERCEELAGKLSAEFGHRALGVATHVGKWEDCDRLVDTVYEEFGRCDILVNNAGMSPLYPDLVSVTEEYWDKVTGVNLKGPFRLGSLVGARMAESGGGRIINVSTIGSLRPARNELVYSCAKAGLNALTIGLANAYAPQVRVNAILPGAVDTDIMAHWPEGQREEAEARIPLGRVGTPRDFVGAALWLAGPASDWVTGTIIRVDGGSAWQTT